MSKKQYTFDEFLQEALHERAGGYEIVQAFRSADSEWLQLQEIVELINESTDVAAIEKNYEIVVRSWLFDHTKDEVRDIKTSVSANRKLPSATPPFELVECRHNNDDESGSQHKREWRLRDRNIPAGLSEIIETRGDGWRDAITDHSNTAKGVSNYVDGFPNDITDAY